MWTEEFPLGGGLGFEITTASFNAKYLAICIKQIYICTHILLYNYYSVYAYFIMDIIMHICILSFINFNKHYIVHLYYWSNSLFFQFMMALVT